MTNCGGFSYPRVTMDDDSWRHCYHIYPNGKYSLPSVGETCTAAASSDDWDHYGLLDQDYGYNNGGVWDASGIECPTFTITVPDSDPSAGSSVRASYRSDSADRVAAGNTQRFPGGKSCSAASVTGGFTCTETAHGLEISGGNDAGSITLAGPGTLKVKGLDLGATAISVPGGKGTDVNGAAQDVSLTGSYSDCSGDASVAGSIAGSAVPGVTGESGLSGANPGGTSVSAGTWHAQDDDCHDILTGKRLAPQDIELPSGDTTITKPSGGTSFSLEYEFDDTYETTMIDGSVQIDGQYDCTVSNHNTNTAGGTGGSGAPTTASAKDTDGRDLWFAGEIHHDGGGAARAYLYRNGALTGVSFASGSTPIPVTATAVERSKFSPVGSFYLSCGANSSKTLVQHLG